MSPEQYQDFVFGGSVSSIVPELAKYRSLLTEYFSKVTDLTPPPDISEFETELYRLEKSVADKILNGTNSIKNLNNLVQEVDEMRKTPYLSDQAIEHLLCTHPPTALNSYLFYSNKKTSLSPRAKLSLTRFTEDYDWQHQYRFFLSKTTRQDYSYRLPECIGVDANDFQIIASQNNHHLKPWGVSHCKETGLIILFENHTPKAVTPQLLKLSVFLHYLFEVHNFSKFLEENNHLQIGQLAKNIIRSKEPLLPFLTDGNAHDETLYWQQAFRQLQNLESIPSIFSATGVLSIGEHMVSTNFIDLLWNMNNISNTNTHKYHLQQESWMELLQHISGYTDTDWKELVEKSLLYDNMTFMSNSLKKA